MLSSEMKQKTQENGRGKNTCSQSTADSQMRLTEDLESQVSPLLVCRRFLFSFGQESEEVFAQNKETNLLSIAQHFCNLDYIAVANLFKAS